MDKATLKSRITLLLSIIGITVLFFLLVPQLYDNSRAEFKYTLLEDGSITIDGYTGSPKTLEVPSEIDGYPVSAISSSAFTNKAELQKVILPDSVKTVGEYAFYNCTALKSVEASGLRVIEQFGFYGCTNLKKVEWSSEVEKIGDSAFASCIHLRSLEVPTSCTYIGTDAFMACQSLVLDCSQNELAAQAAEQYGIPTEFVKSDDFLILITGGIVLGVIAVAGVILLVRARRKKAKK